MWSTACRTEAAPGLPARSNSSTWVGLSRAMANSVATKKPLASTSAIATINSIAIPWL
jgi:hypothetical protein